MIFDSLSNFLRKRTYFGLALTLPAASWAILTAGFGGILILSKSNFEATGTKTSFLISLIVLTLAGFVTSLVDCGLSRAFGKKWENEHLRVLNDYIIKGEIVKDISDSDLLKLYDSCYKAYKFLSKRTAEVTLWVVFGVVLIEYIVSGQFTNVPIILIGGFMAVFLTVIFNIYFGTTPIFSLIARDCRKLLFERNIPFKEIAVTTFKTKFFLFILLTALIILAIFVLTYPPPLSLISVSIIGFIMVTVTIQTIFTTFYQSLEEISKSAERLGGGGEVVIFSGSTDQEIISLSENINKTAHNIKKYQKELEEARSVLEIKVNARTKELKELSESLEEQVKKRTKELQAKVRELEKFQKLSIGRELKMIELKKRIRENKKEIGKK